MATGRRYLGGVPRLTRRAWEDVAQQLEDFLRKIYDSESNGIPAGFNDEVPAEVLGPVGTGIGDPGTEGTGWAAANHQHVASVGTPHAIGPTIPSEEGTESSLSRSDHKHEVVLYRSAGLTMDGGSAVISTGFKGYVPAPYSGTIQGWEIRADQVGSCVIDVWKAWRTPGVTDSICGAAKPALSGESTADGDTTGWTNLTVTKGEIFGFNVDSASSVTLLTVVVTVRES